MSGFFSADRAVKYGHGVVRLALLTLYAFQWAPQFAHGGPALAQLSMRAYLQSGRWLAHSYLGSVGAAVNVRVLGLSTNLALLSVAAALCVRDVRHDWALLAVLAKTFAGDFVAGKLDTKEWRLVLLFTACFAASAWVLEGHQAAAAYAPYARIFPAMLLVQAVCELGDNHLESLVFFRHRFSFELFSFLLLTALRLTAVELRVVQHDLVVCLFYRLSNFLIIALRSPAFWLAVRKACFTLFGLLRGVPLVNVTDAETAMAVLRLSDEKGAALERFVATPAWLPILSLESVDGPLHRAMLGDLHTLMATLKPPSALQVIARRLCDGALAEGRPIDAERVAQISTAAFIEYLFDQQWQPESMQVLVDASWEWRKEIAVRGRADAAVKARAVAATISLIRGHAALWSLFGERWSTPRYYSLIMQPFLLSPAINVGDIAVTLARRPELSVEEAIRSAHPFPILERFVREDVVTGDGRTLVRAGTQVIVFTSDLAGETWPPFGAGPRACAGTSLALALLRPMHASLRSHPLFQPDKGHRYSGRNNDGAISVREALYFARIILPVVLGGGGRSEVSPAGPWPAGVGE